MCRPKTLTGAQGSVQVGFENRIPLGFGDFESRRPLGAAGAVYQDLHAAEFRRHRVQKMVEAGAVRDIASLNQRSPAQRLTSAAAAA